MRRESRLLYYFGSILLYFYEYNESGVEALVVTTAEPLA